MDKHETLPAWEFGEEHYARGLAFRTAARTITEADIVAFAGLSGDWNPQHCDAEWAARNSRFGARIAHGSLIESVAEGLVPTHLLSVAMSTGSEVVLKNPVLIGDTIHVVGTRPEKGAAIDLRVLNQRDALVSRVRFHFDDGHLAQNSIPPLPPSPIPTAVIDQDELYSGAAFETRARTITEADIVSFAQISGGWSPDQCDKEWAQRESVAGGRFAPRELVIAATTGVLPLDPARLVAARDRYLVAVTPVAIDDTIRAVGGVAASVEINADFVKETWYWHVVNQRDEAVLSTVINLVMRPQSENR